MSVYVKHNFTVFFKMMTVSKKILTMSSIKCKLKCQAFKNNNMGLQTVKFCVNSHVGLRFFFPEVETQITV